eukprot:702580-Prymnesium_polylepis.2
MLCTQCFSLTEADVPLVRFRPTDFETPLKGGAFKGLPDRRKVCLVESRQGQGGGASARRSPVAALPAAKA